MFLRHKVTEKNPNFQTFPEKLTGKENKTAPHRMRMRGGRLLREMITF
jgi:hypothetical protein